MGDEDRDTDDQIRAARAAVEVGSSLERPVKKRGGRATKYRKAPQAPKRFKSSYILFSMAKQEELKKEGVAVGGAGKVTSTSKKIAVMWRNLSAEERKKWDEKAKEDKIRYMAEKSLYTGPWQVPTKRAKKDPTAPKRPMSAFLFFSQGKRQEVKEENPEMKNTDVSRILGELWRNASEEEKKPHIEREAKEREQYNKEMAEWKVKKAESDRIERERREAIASDAIKSGLVPGANAMPTAGMMHPMGMMPAYPPMDGMPPGMAPMMMMPEAQQQGAAAGEQGQEGKAPENVQEGQQQMYPPQGYYYPPPMYFAYGQPPMPMQGMPSSAPPQEEQPLGEGSC